ncbi:MAG: polysaccharide biosynthesis/export family protein [Bacteroidaceae bacterium]|nr:polysaccharide biosynthesis/export family protein [Bacteroidaceae bacterium]
MPLDSALVVPSQYETRIKPGDRLAIHVSCTKQELAVPFNALSYHVSSEGGTSSSNETDVQGYLVDDQGYINFPILGRLHVGGLTMPQTSEYIKGLLTEGKHIPDAAVDTRITNFTIYGLGALSPGKLVVPDSKINILQAVAQMGDLQSRAQYNKVRVIREEDDLRMEFDIDLTKRSLYASPAFYLQQNDIVYAEPKKQKSEATNKATMWVSIAAVLASIAYSITYMLK